MDTLDIVIEDDRWQSVDIVALAQTSVQATLKTQNLNPDQTEITILACDDSRIAALNTEFRDKPSPTNVLSWPSEERAAMRAGDKPQPPKQGLDGVIELGDIAISFDTCHAEAETAGKTIDAHVTHLIVHGMLHLLGYDHIRDPDATLMERLEAEILGKLGHDDPYNEPSAHLG